MTPLISPEALRERSDIVLLDARSGADVAERFIARRLAGARHVDLERDLSAPGRDAAVGGRHPLPAPAAFSATLGRLGLTPESHVVVYDDQGGGNAAARCWWMLRAVGHAAVQVLDGGLDAAIGAGLPTASGPPEALTPAPPYPLDGYASPRLDADAVATALQDPARVGLDARAAARFRGEMDPYDPRPGHIPGTRSAPWTDNLDGGGRLLSPEALRARYAPLVGDRRGSDIVASCGSGVTACHILLALEVAGYGLGALYVGSFSEWTRQGRPVERGADG